MERYRVLRTIGKGSFGAALVATNTRDGRNYVIKQVNISKLSRRQQEEAHNETRVLAAMQHPNIVAYKESFLHRGNLCIVMELAEGGDLEKFLKKRAGRLLPESQVIGFFSQICLAMKHVHDRKVRAPPAPACCAPSARLPPPAPS